VIPANGLGSHSLKKELVRNDLRRKCVKWRESAAYHNERRETDCLNFLPISGLFVSVPHLYFFCLNIIRAREVNSTVVGAQPRCLVGRGP
jgi:hypothetical protein